MSQSGILSVVTGGGPVIETLTGNSGGPVGPDGAFNINVVGNNSSGINIVGNPGTNTLTVTAFQATTSQEGTVTLATNAQAIAGTDTANALTSSNLTAKLGTQTAHSLAVFEGSSSALTALGVASNGQLPIGSTGADPVLATLTAGTGISITNGAGSISIAINGGTVGETITGNSGGALSPTAGNWNILGASTAAGTSPVTTSGSVSTLTLNVQKSQAIAATDATKIGLSNFNSAQFTVDANGFVSTSGTGIPTTLTGNTGGAISPTAGNINTLGTGSITIAGSGSTLTTQLTGLTNHAVQVGGGTATLTQLSVGTNGQVLIGATTADPAFATLTSSDSSISFTTGANTLSLQVAGGSTTIKTITGNSGGAESPSAGNFNILGTGSITVAGSANTETVQLTGLTNHAIQIGAGTATLTQLGAGTTGQVLQTNTTADPTWSTATYPSTTTINQLLYSSSANTVAGLATANNGVHITGTTGIPSVLAAGTTGQILTATTGSPPSWASPATSGTVTSVSVATANGFAGTVANPTTTPAITLTTSQTGLLSGNGTAITGTAITQYNVLTAGASNAPNNVAPSATSGIPLISQGSSAQPVFGTAVVAGGGTGNTTFTAYSIIAAGTTATGAFQNVSGVGTSGQVLTSNGASALPTWQSNPAGAVQVVRQVFTSTGTYTPTSGMVYCDVEVLGGGGGGGGGATSAAANASLGAGGGAGGYTRKIITAAAIGASQAVTVGAAGTAGANTGGNGGTGGTSSLGAIISATGGVGGLGAASATAGGYEGGAGGAGSSGDFNTNGAPGSNSVWYVAGSVYLPSAGGSSFFGGGAQALVVSAGPGNAATSYGGGGGGALTAASTGQSGGVGFKGIVIVTEYI